MFTQMGVSNAQMALFTSLLYLPWTIKPLWSPFVDIIRTKRWWVLVMQSMLTVCMVLLTLTLPHPLAEQISEGSVGISVFTITLILFIISAFSSATHDIAADGLYMLALTEHEQAAYIGLRSVFYRLSNVFCNSALVFVAGWIESRGTSVPVAWQITLAVAAAIFTILTLWHLLFLPKTEQPAQSIKAGAVLRDVGRTFVEFFRKPHILIALLFILLYRLPEAFLLKMVTPFMLGSAETGGMGITLEQYSIVYGMSGVVFLLLGGVLGGVYASKKGLKHCLWLMAAAITLPDVVYLVLSMTGSVSIWWIAVAIAIEQFGYGFGFTAYMLYLMFFSQGEKQTSHYALCTAFMAIGMMLPGMVAGYLQEAVGYSRFFAVVMCLCIVTLAKAQDRKSTRLNSSHISIGRVTRTMVSNNYAVV